MNRYVCLCCFDTMDDKDRHDPDHHYPDCPMNDFASVDWIVAQLLKRDRKLLQLIRPERAAPTTGTNVPK